MNISKYMVAEPLNEDEMLLYSTISTSLVVLNNDIYADIFKKHNFEEHRDDCAELVEMGFLFEGAADSQIRELEKIRAEVVDNHHGLTSVTIAPTMSCNARCYYCFEKGAKWGTMSPETADAVSAFLINRCTEKNIYIAWFGGEPTLAVDIIKRITDALKDAGIHVEATITTNGLLIDEGMLALFKECGIERVQITLDGLGEDYNRVKNYIYKDIPDPFERIMQNIGLIIKRDMNCHLRVNYYSNRYDVVKETMDYLHGRFGAYDKLYLYGAPLDLPSEKGYSEFDENEGNIFLQVLDDSLKRGYENDEINFRELKVSPDYNIALGELMLAPFPASCLMVNKDRFVIDDKGFLYKCQKHLGHADFNCGNVFDGVDENRFYHFYVTDKLNNPKCEGCNMLPICQGGCNANRLIYGDKFACPPSKSILNKLVKRYYEYVTAGNEY